ncbi:MAG: hypothetical protein LBV75_05150 [Paludibacter sp.]|jgi:hypothetical protein|nr:hypothetical protein [Paludibacter sp.]
MEKEFYEKQRFPLWMRILITVGITAILGLMLYEKDVDFTKQATFFGDYVPVIVLGFVIALFWIFNLQTIVNKDGVYVKFVPFQRKFKAFAWEDIVSSEVKKYNPLLETGGWGFKVQLNISFNKKLTTAYNISGNKCLFLHLNSGKKILIGTQKAQELDEYLKDITSVSKKRKL